MKTIILAFRLIKSRFANIMILAVELAVSCIVMTGIIGLILDKQSYKKIANSLASDDNYFFVAYDCYDLSFDISERFPEDENLKVSYHDIKSGSLSLKKSAGMMKFLCFDDFLWYAMELPPDDKIVRYCEKNGYIPGIGFEEKYKKEEVIETSDGNKIYVYDTFRSDRKIFLFSHYSSKSIFSIDSLVGEAGEADLMFLKKNIPNDWLLRNTYLTATGVVSIDSDYQNLQNAIDTMESYGSVISLKQLALNFEKDRQRELITNLALLTVFIIIAMIGIIGINSIWLKKNEKNFAIMYITGMSGKTHWIIETIEGLMIFFLGFVFFLIALFIWGKKLVPFKFGEMLLPTILIVFVFLLLTYWITTYRSMKNINKKNLINIYKRDNYGN